LAKLDDAQAGADELDNAASAGVAFRHHPGTETSVRHAVSQGAHKVGQAFGCILSVSVQQCHEIKAVL